jgi:hypothetical protein
LLIDKFRFTKTLIITPVMTYDLENKMERRFFQDELMRGRDYLDYVKEVLYRGRYQSAARGCVIGAPPYGYNKVKIGKDWTLEPNENADIVRMIFNWYVKEQKSPGQIGKELNKLMIPPSKGKIWGRESVRLILKNVHYDGKVVFGRKKTTVVFMVLLLCLTMVLAGCRSRDEAQNDGLNDGLYNDNTAGDMENDIKDDLHNAGEDIKDGVDDILDGNDQNKKPAAAN